MLDKIPPLTPVEELSALVIDNQSLVHEMMAQALRDIGLRKVKCAFNAYHAIRLCEEHQFDFVFIAFNVSSDKDGFHLLEELKFLQHITEKTTVVFLSAETSEELVNCIVELQPDDFWVKPLDSSRIKLRLNHLFSIRKKLHKLLHCLHSKEYSAAIYYAERQLDDKNLSDYHPRLRRIIGDCLRSLRQYETAETYYRTLLQGLDYAWVNVGLVDALLQQDKKGEADELIDKLVERKDTRFLIYDLLAAHYIEKEAFDRAYEQMKLASQLAPRNIQRNKRVWDLARLNHDKNGQLIAVQNMAKYAKNSIHDSPELSLNVIRATIDLATATGEGDADKLTRKAESDLYNMQQKIVGNREIVNQMTVLNSRILCLRDQKSKAEKLIFDNNVSATAEGSLEENLDKMKAFHELGMREESMRVLNSLSTLVEADNFSGQVINAYLEQESIERQEINFTAKELKQMAASNYKENRMLPAYDNLRQAMIISPKDKQLAMSLLKVIVNLKTQELYNEEQREVAIKAAGMLMRMQLQDPQKEKLALFCSELDLFDDSL